ncbi:MAG: hypothetical protein A4E61_00339 [Syntrophorhabdus sp. PtaB.Bin184]|nr:MAG: hypothetical protein A4E61_00339 [Syntrophorhabdus sp. PtaB.Bin184]
MPEEKREAVRAFLRAFKKVAHERGIYFIPRKGFTETLAWLGYTKTNCRDEILGLTVDDYCKGPEPDRDMPGEGWVFGMNMSGSNIYIKLKLTKAGSQTIAKCVSFHPAKHNLRFPLRDEGEGEKK